jgi:1-acyl-sn-glycerol-3-phosphate acyltransferase
VLEIVSALVMELRAASVPPSVSPNDSLERDLGVSSLERVELWLRLEREFGVRLPDTTMAEADTPADLAAALLRAAPAAPEIVPPVRTPVGAAVAAPVHVRTLVDALRWHVEATPDRVHIFLREDQGEERPITYRELWDGATAVAAALGEHGVGRGETVALMLRTEQAFFRAFFGVLLAGAVPVPMYPPFRADRIEEYAHRQAGILRNAGARLLVTFAEAERVGSLLRGTVPELREVVPVDRLTSSGRITAAFPTAGDMPALIQYTSGSTGDPKGVLLTHANILANIRAIGQAIEIRPEDVCVSWLPLYHDMGLIGTWLGALYFGVPIAILSPLAFLARPSRWLWAIHAHRATISPAPNFAFDLCMRKITDEEIEGLDLTCWRLAFNGSEAVSAETIEGFTKRFARYGFRPDAMYPVYGLAEASVGLTMPPQRRLPRIDAIAREAFQHAREIRPAGSDDLRPLRFVSCGRPLPGHEVRIVDAAGRLLGERFEGRIQFRGPSVTRGYFRHPAATRAAFVGDWLDSGDLGYWADGELFITGREKDLIIRGGRNIAPQEAEEVAGTVTDVRKGCVAAFGVYDPAIGTERLVIVAETRVTDVVRCGQIHRDVIARVTEALGVPPDQVLIAPPGTVLKTPSGKIRRAATREAFQRGELLAPRRSVTLQLARLFVEGVRARLQRAADRLGRLLFTGYAIALLLIALPLLWGLLRLVSPGRAADRMVKRWSRLALALVGLAPRVSGVEHLEQAGSAVLVANHASYIDSVVLMAALPMDFRFIAKQALTSYPMIGTVIRRAGHITIEKADLSQRLAGADQITEALRGGISIAVFPEGTFFRPPGILPFRLGAFRAAVDAGRPVVPITLRGTRDVLPDGTWLLRRLPIDVSVSAPLVPVAQGWPEMVRLRDLARADIARGAGEPLIEGGATAA